MRKQLIYLLIIIFLGVYAVIKTQESAQLKQLAEQHLTEAEKNHAEAIKQKELAEKQLELALNREALANHERNRAEKLAVELEKCKGKR